MVDIVGFVAGILTSINLIPQLIHSIKTKQVEDISLANYVIYDVGLLMWTVYGFMIASWPIIIMDGFACLASFGMTYIKVRYSKI